MSAGASLARRKGRTRRAGHHGPGRWWRAGVVLGLLFCAGLAPSAAAADDTRAAEEAATKRKLEAVREAMRELEAARAATRGERTSLLGELREQEFEVARVARELNALDGELRGKQAELDALAEQARALEARLDAQREQVAALLRSAYALGRHGQLRLLFAPEDAGDVARLLGYHRYLQNDRSRRIRELGAQLLALAQLRQALEQVRTALAATRAEREREAQALDAARGERRARLAALEASLSDQRARLGALGRDEKALLELLARLRDAIADVPSVLAGSEPFGSRRGRVPWPLVGRLDARFGSPGADGRTLEGLVIGAEAGREVRAVGHGRVAYADWLKGYGLLAIVDHGDGWMSLYAHNEALLRDVGDWVESGDAIATVGSSGGRRDVALYFELRRHGQPIDPLPWLVARR